MNGRLRRAVGLMSGTSLDGIDVAFLETDGRVRVTAGPAITVPYEEKLRTRLRSVLGGQGLVAEAEPCAALRVCRSVFPAPPG